MKELSFKVKLEKDDSPLYPNKLECLFARKVENDKFMRELIRDVKELLHYIYVEKKQKSKLIVNNGFDIYNIGSNDNYQTKGGYTFTVVVNDNVKDEIKNAILGKFSSYIDAI